MILPWWGWILFILLLPSPYALALTLGVIHGRRGGKPNSKRPNTALLGLGIYHEE